MLNLPLLNLPPVLLQVPLRRALRSSLVLVVLGLSFGSACRTPEEQPPPAVAVPPSIRACSQNLQRFGERSERWSRNKEQTQGAFLLERMQTADCDVVALQEVAGASRREARARAELLASGLTALQGVPFAAEVAGSRDRFIRNAILYRTDLFELRRIYDFSTKALPRLQHIYGPSGHYSRGPLVLHLRLRGGTNDFLFATMHFKSKSGGFRDPTGTEYELRRMESAEGLRRALGSLLETLPSETIVVLSGDRNSDAPSATAAILEGRRRLQSFGDGSCELDRQERPRCTVPEREPELIALFGRSEAVEQRRLRSHSYRGRESLIDEILLRPRDLWRVLDAEGRLQIGMKGEYFKGSDHRLLWAELRLAPDRSHESPLLPK